MRVLLIGSGSREHAIGYALKKSPKLKDLFAIPGNPGIATIASCHNLDITDNELICQFCLDKAIDFVIIGPEQPLAGGMVDALQKHNILVFGPNAAASKLESSKAFTKELCEKYNIPTAAFGCFTKIEEAKKFASNQVFPLVIKADGLAAGKGVIIAVNLEQALAAIDELSSSKFGKAGETIVIEEFLIGTELSFFALSDGKSAKFFAAAHDYKRIGDNDTGPNTGGMGSISPSPILTEALKARIMNEIIEPTVMAMQDKGIPYHGMLFAGIMVTKDGPKLLEYNARFGDPETQSIILTLESDLLSIIYDAARGELEQINIRYNQKNAITVIMATNGYPDNYPKGTIIKQLDSVNKLKDVLIFHAGTAVKDDQTIAVGGRVLAISSSGDSFEQARAQAYAAVKMIDWPEGFYRTDIGDKYY